MNRQGSPTRAPLTMRNLNPPHDSVDRVAALPLELFARVFEYLEPEAILIYQQVSKTWRYLLSSDAIMGASVASFSAPGDLELQCQRVTPALSSVEVSRRKFQQIHRFRRGLPADSTSMPMGAPSDRVVCNEMAFCGETVAWVVETHPVSSDFQEVVIAHNLRTSKRILSAAHVRILGIYLSDQYLVYLVYDAPSECFIVNLESEEKSSLSLDLFYNRGYGEGRDCIDCVLGGNGHYITVHPEYIEPIQHRPSLPMLVYNTKSKQSRIIEIDLPRSYLGERYSKGFPYDGVRPMLGPLYVNAMSETATIIQYGSHRSWVTAADGHEGEQRLDDCSFKWHETYHLKTGDRIASNRDSMPDPSVVVGFEMYPGAIMRTNMADGALHAYIAPVTEGDYSDEMYFVGPNLQSIDSLNDITTMELKPANGENLQYLAWKDVELYVEDSSFTFQRPAGRASLTPPIFDRNSKKIRWTRSVDDIMVSSGGSFSGDLIIERAFCNEWFLVIATEAGELLVCTFDPDLRFPDPSTPSEPVAAVIPAE